MGKQLPCGIEIHNEVRPQPEIGLLDQRQQGVSLQTMAFAARSGNEDNIFIRLARQPD